MKKCLRKVLLLSASLGLALVGFSTAACGQTSVGEHQHLYGPWTVISAATCTENGMRSHTCVICKGSAEEEIPALGHNFDGGRETKPASCMQTGERTQTCSRCGLTQTTDIPTANHNWDAGVVLVQPTCQTEGSMRLTCKTCLVSQTVSLGFGAHDPVETSRTEAKCTSDGSISYRCTVCNQTLDDVAIPALGHRWRLGEDDLEPTCTEAGYRDRICERCGQQEKQTIASLGHELPEEFTIDKLPTFDDTGLKSQHCIRCGAHENVTVIPKLDENSPIEYEFRILRNNGNKLSEPSIVITVYDGAQQVAQSTPSTLVNGVFRFSLLPKAYTVTVSNLPEGYSAETVTMQPGNPYCDIYLTAAPIRSTAPSGTRYTVGSVMYDFTLSPSMTTSGKSYTLSELLKEKKAVVLNFWATWCGPCQSEFPLLNQVYEQLKGDIEVLAIDQSTSDNLQSVKQFASSYGLTFPMAFDSVNRLQSMFGVTDIPTTVIIDAEGVVCEVHTGTIVSADQFRAMFSPYLADGYWKNTPAVAALGSPCILPQKRTLTD